MALPPQARWRFPIRAGLSALALTTLFSGAFLGMLLQDFNRQDLLWTRADTVLLFALIAVLAGIGLGLAFLLDRVSRGWFFRRGRHFIPLLAAVALLQMLPAKALPSGLDFDVAAWILLGAGLLLSLLSGRFPDNPVQAALWRATPALALLYPLLFVNLVTQPSLCPVDQLPAARTAPPADGHPPVVIFLFDGLARASCVDENGAWRNDLPNLKKFAQTAVEYTQALSGGINTTAALPNFIFQRDADTYSQIRWSDAMLAQDPLAFTNGIFYTAKQEGYRTLMSSLALPFPQLFGPLLDAASVAPFARYVAAPTLAGRLLNMLANLAFFARGPFAGHWYAEIPRIRYVPGWLTEDAYRDLTFMGIDRIQAQLATAFGPQDLMFAHLNLPHLPTIFLEDGTVDGIRATYDTQLRFADQVWGEFLETLQTAGVFHDAWIIFTSDHGHYSLRLGAEHRHVPLLIRPPAGTYAPRQVAAPLNMWEMGPFFRAVFQSRPAEECLALLPQDGIPELQSNP